MSYIIQIGYVIAEHSWEVCQTSCSCQNLFLNYTNITLGRKLILIDILLSLIPKPAVLRLSGRTNIMVVEVVELDVNILILGDEHKTHYCYNIGGRCIPPQFADVVTSNLMIQILRYQSRSLVIN